MPDPLTDQFWEEESDAMTGILTPFIISAARDGVNGGIELMVEIGIDFTDISTEFIETYARSYAFDMVQGINNTTRNHMQEIYVNWISTGGTMQDLEDALSVWFSDARAEMIAITETTRLFAEANILAWQQTGVVTGKVWQTAGDDLVCPICGPLQGIKVGLDGNGFTTEDDGLGLFSPPAHVRCRCWLAPVVDL